MARALGRDLGVSTKESIEICRHIKDKNIVDAKKMLSAAVELKRPIALSRFNQKVAHKPGMGPGRYLCSTAKSILSVLENLETNAQQKGLSTANLVIVHACAHQAARPFHASRKRGRRMKRTHVEIVCEEKAVERKKTVAKKAAKPAKPAEKKQETTVAPAGPKAEAKPADVVAEKPAEQKAAPAEAKPEPKIGAKEPVPSAEPKPAEEKPATAAPEAKPTESIPAKEEAKPKEESS